MVPFAWGFDEYIWFDLISKYETSLKNCIHTILILILTQECPFSDIGTQWDFTEPLKGHVKYIILLRSLEILIAFSRNNNFEET